MQKYGADLLVWFVQWESLISIIERTERPARGLLKFTIPGLGCMLRHCSSCVPVAQEQKGGQAISLLTSIRCMILFANHHRRF